MAGQSIDTEERRPDRPRGAPAADKQSAQRRPVGSASAWIAQLQRQGGAGKEIFVARTPQRGAFLIEGTMRRSIKAGILVPALVRLFGPVRELHESDISRFGEGPPVEVFEAPSGPAFLLVGGRRLPIRGLPLPYAVSQEEADAFRLGDEVNVSLGAIGIAAAGTPGTSPVRRAKQIIAREGVVNGTATLARKAAARVRARVAPRR